MEINKIICGDCLEVMKDFPDKSIDLVLGSPPFLDEDIPEDYYQWFGKIIEECKRIAKIVFLFNSSKRLVEISKKFEPNRILIWDKKRTESAYRYEPIFCWTKEVNLNKYVWNDCLAYMPVLGKQQEVPYQNPIQLYETLIMFFREEVKLVLDPFLGSGTTVIACKRLKRNFIGIEINPDYCKIAEERLRGQPEPLF